MGMKKQRLEGHFREVISKNKNIYYLKLQVNPLAHTVSPADFFIQNKDRNIMVECKECSGKSFVFSRLTQLNDLLRFDKFSDNNMSFILLSFWKGSKKKSKYYYIEIKEFKKFMSNINKKSCNEKDLDKMFFYTNLQGISLLYNSRFDRIINKEEIEQIYNNGKSITEQK